MSPQAIGGNVALLAAACAAGMLFGWGYFEALRRSVAWYGPVPGRAGQAAGRADRANRARRPSRAGSVAWTAGRLLSAVAFFAFTAHLGALPLLLALLGFLVARSIALRTARSAP